MSWRPHPRRADTDPDYPQAWGTSDRDGFVSNLYKLRWQMQWSGNELINTRFLVSEEEYDIPQEQLRTLILPADPAPLFNARPEPYAIDETSWLATQDEELIETNSGINIVTNPANIDMVGASSGSGDFSTDFSTDFSGG